MGLRMTPRSPLDDPASAAHAWARYKRILRTSGVVSVPLALLSLAAIYVLRGPISIHLYIATALGVVFIVMLTGALMGLVFLSSGTGHDEAVLDPLEDKKKR